MPKLSQALIDGNEIETRFGRARIKLRCVGELNCVSGQLVACDPWLVHLAEPLVHTVKPGRYPVYLSIAEDSIDQRIIAATIRFKQLEVESWTTAVTRTPWYHRYEYREEFTQIIGTFNYPVSSKNGCFMDWTTAGAMLASEIDELGWDRKIHQLKRLNYEPTRSWADVLVESTRQLNALVFSSGIGDGNYGTYWGIQNNETVALITDFGVLSESDLTTTPGYTATWLAQFS